MPHWIAHLEGGPQRVNHAAVTIGEKIYMFGGYCTGEDFTVRKPIDIHTFNCVSYKWSKVQARGASEDVPYMRYGHTAVSYRGLAYIFGGRNDRDGVCGTLFCFDPVTCSWSRPVTSGMAPEARDGHSACVIGSSMYLYGGYEEATMEFSMSVFALNLETMHWSFRIPKGEPAQWRDFHSATAWRHYMVIFGGRGDESGPIHTARELYCNRICLFDTRTDTWCKPDATGEVPMGRRSHNAFEYKDKIYIFGGYNGKEDLHFNDMYAFDPVGFHWTRIEPLGMAPTLRRRSCCCRCDDRFFLFGGTSPHVIEGRTELLDLADLHVLDMNVTLRTLCMVMVHRHNLDCSCLPRHLRFEIKNIFGCNDIRPAHG